MRLILAIVLLLAPVPPRLVAIDAGLVVIVWENADADSATVFNVDNTACPYPTIVDGLWLGTTLTQVPEGPPYDARCALRGGDRLYLLRYRERVFVGQDGPFVVPVRVWLPVVQR
jgi:hypothetical protein